MDSASDVIIGGRKRGWGGWGRFRQWDVVFCRCRQFRESWEIGGVDGLRWIRSGPCDYPLVCLRTALLHSVFVSLFSLLCVRVFSFPLSLSRAPELLPSFFFSCVGRLFSAFCVVFVFAVYQFLCFPFAS